MNREKLLTDLYKSAFPLVARYISKQGGSFDDAKDVFQDALIIYYEKAVAGNLAAADHKAYLLGIARHLWFRKFRESNNAVCLQEGLSLVPLETDEQISANKILQYLETAGKRCVELLSAFYYHQLPMKDIAGLFGYAGERSVTVQKYKCLEKVKNTVKERSLDYADFIE